MSAPFAHVGGVPVEEIVASFGPVLFMAGAMAATLRTRWRRVRPVVRRARR
jgi:hypothetical protein